MTTKAEAKPTPPAALAKPEEKGPVATLRDALEARRESLSQLVPKHLTTERLMKVALNSVAKTPALKLCTMSSILQCVMTSAELGLEPGGALGHAYLVPFKDTCTLIIGYRGLIDLIRRSGQLASIRAVVVHSKDRFRFTEGIEQGIEHEPFLDGDPGLMTRVYCVAKLKDGSVQVEVMSKNDVDKIKGRSRASSSGPWVTDYEEMAKKTVLRRIAKWLPMSVETWERAVETDNEDFVDGEVVSTDPVPEETPTQRAKAALKARPQIVDAPELPDESVAAREDAIDAEVAAKAGVAKGA